jgi:hypothetical protein
VSKALGIYYKLRNFLVFRISKIKIIWLISASKFSFSSSKTNLKIVTGADSSHFKSLLNLLNSIQKFEPETPVTIWDLGFTDSEIGFIDSAYPNYFVKKFDYSKYPSHFNIKVKAGEYAWKPTIIFEEFKVTDGILLWLDGGDVLTRKLFWIKKFITKTGFFSPYSLGTIKQWTHHKMIQNFELKNALLNKPNLNGAIVGFDSKSKEATNLLNAWYECAQNVDCIAPEGSSRENHRQDQAALTCLAYKQRMVPNGFYAVIRSPLGIKIHQDAD